MRTLVIVRTHRADPASIAAFDRLADAPGIDVVFGVDERQGRVDFGPRASVGYTNQTLRSMGLYAHPQCGWRCGDYIYYIVRAGRPQYDRYWLIEPDVRINVADLGAFFASFDGNNNDFIAPRFGTRDERWEWSGNIVRAGLRPAGCVFPLTRMTGHGIDLAYRIRRRHSEDPVLATPTTWPNDESFVASALIAEGAACGDLSNGGPPCYSSASLAIGAVFDYTLIESAPPDGLVYHPVRDFSEWMARAEARLLQITNAGVGGADTARLRSEASFLNAVAETCLRHPRFADAALLPLMVAQPRWEAREWAGSLPPGDEAADINRSQIVASRLARRFGVTPSAPPVATAHLATCQQNPENLGIVSANDFALGAAFPISRFPRGFAVPYSFDPGGSALLFTLHLRLDEMVDEPVFYQAQRQRSRVIVRAPFDRLTQIFGQRDASLAPALVFSNVRGGATSLERLLRATTSRFVCEPDALSQLGSDRATFLGFPSDLQQSLLYHAVAPFLDLTFADERPGPCVLKLRPAANSLAPHLADIFPQAKFVFVFQDRQMWSREIFRSLRLRPEMAVDRLINTVKSAHALKRKNVDLSIVAHADIVRAPAELLPGLVGAATEGALQRRLANVQATEVVPATGVTQGMLGTSTEDESQWLQAFEAIWLNRSPRSLIAELGMEL